LGSNGLAKNPIIDKKIQQALNDKDIFSDDILQKIKEDTQK
jgi:hypothetical protein